MRKIRSLKPHIPFGFVIALSYKSWFSVAVPDPKDDTKCIPERANVVPFANGTCLELIKDPKKSEDDASEYVLIHFTIKIQ